VFLVLAVLPAAVGRPGHANRTGAGVEPFLVGEKLTYHVEWSPPWYLFFLPSMDAGEVVLELADGGRVRDRQTLRVLVTARSSGTLAKLAGVTVDDYFEAHTDPESLCTLQVSKRIREGKRKRDIDVVYHPEEGRLHIREVNVAPDPPKVDRDETIAGIPPCVRDIFSALYYVRRNNLEPGASYRSTVGDDGNIKEIEARVEKKESVKGPTGRFEAWKVNTVALFGGLFKSGGQFRIWITADDRRLPVRFEVNVSLGKVVGQLKSFITTQSYPGEDRSQP